MADFSGINRLMIALPTRRCLPLSGIGARLLGALGAAALPRPARPARPNPRLAGPRRAVTGQLRCAMMQIQGTRVRRGETTMADHRHVTTTDAGTRAPRDEFSQSVGLSGPL